MDKITREGCILYLENWTGVLKEEIRGKKLKDMTHKERLYEEQSMFLDKAIEELKKG